MLQTPKPPEPITIELAGVPRGKGRPRFARVGPGVRTYTDAATRSYEGDLKAAAAAAMAGRAPLDGPVAVQVRAPTVKPDLDNITKLLDALNEVVFRDDKQIVSGLVYKFYSERPRLEVSVTPMVAV